MHLKSQFLDDYRSFFEGRAYDELYKWRIAKTVVDNWNLDDPDLAAMIDRSFAHPHQNLWAGAHYFPKAMLMEWAARTPEDTRAALRELLHGVGPLADRMRSFEQRSIDHVRAARPGEKLNTYQGMRAMALWLGMVLPEHHYLYKSSMVSGYLKNTGHAPLMKPGDKYTAIDAYYQLCDEVRALLLARPDIIEAHRAIRGADCHPDPEHHLLVQDFIYFIGEHMDPKQVPSVARGAVGLIMVNITWNSNDWQGPSQDKSNHGFVKEGNTPMESWNFDLENVRNPNGQVLGFVQHTAPPKLDGDNNLIVFHSAGKVVGFYGKSRLLKDKPRASDGNEYNIIGDRSLALVLPNKLEDIKTKGYLEDKQRMGQNGFIYLKDPATALRMIDEAIALNPVKKETLNALRDWVTNGHTSAASSTTRMSMEHPLNTILYGPPGTGKTYHAITHAVAIIDGLPIEEVKAKSREQVRARYEQLAEARLVRTVTFHQSFSYEDFVEGIKPQTHNNKDGEDEVKLVTYEVQDGIFKLMCASARSGERGGGGNLIDDGALAKANFYKVSLGQYNSPADDEIYAYCIANDVIAVGYGGTVDVSKATDEAGIKAMLKGAGFKEDGEGFRYTVSVLRTMHLDMKGGDIVLVSAGNSMVRAIGRVSGGYFMDENAPIRFKEFLKVDWLVKDAEIPVEDLYPKNLSMGTLYSLDRNLVKKDYFRRSTGTPEKRHERYVLIIDEINRGNVASIFGELITLIEDDKRDGGKEPAKVKLPYSKKDDFSVPTNLYLLGTMNTADRSVEALDTALRRRFSFVEMPSQPELIEPAMLGDLDLRALLRTINERVEQLMDKDHHIGHSYFMGLKSAEDLKRMFATKVIPLLEEYFHGDAKKVGAILGEAFVEVRKKTIAFAKGFDMDEYEVKELYTVKAPCTFTDLEPFKAIYAGA